MLPTKFLRFAAPLCGALLLARAPIALAQDAAAEVATEVAAPANDYPAPASTPEAAGEMFYKFLAAGKVRHDSQQRQAFDVGLVIRYLGSISRAQVTAISASPSQGKLEQMLALLAQQKDEPQYEGKIVGTQGEQTFVEVSPASAKKRSVVVVPEDGGFRVDLKATFGRWNDLDGEKLDVAWFDSTGIFSPALANNATFIANRARSSCQSNLKQAMLGILQYSQDYDETFPSANKWVDQIMPYVKSEQIFRCPSLPDGSNYGYALNQNLGALNMAKMNNISQTVAIYETDDLARNAFGAGEERAYRHLGGSNIAFADGHVKWFAQGKETPESVTFKP